MTIDLFTITCSNIAGQSIVFPSDLNFAKECTENFPGPIVAQPISEPIGNLYNLLQGGLVLKNNGYFEKTLPVAVKLISQKARNVFQAPEAVKCSFEFNNKQLIDGKNSPARLSTNKQPLFVKHSVPACGQSAVDVLQNTLDEIKGYGKSPKTLQLLEQFKISVYCS